MKNMDMDLTKLKLNEIRTELCKRGIPAKGTKPVLLRKLTKALGKVKSEKGGSGTDNNEAPYDKWMSGQKKGNLPNCFNDKFKNPKSHAYAGSITNTLYQSFFQHPIKEERLDEEINEEEIENDEETMEDYEEEIDDYEDEIQIEDYEESDNDINQAIIKEEPIMEENDYENEGDNYFESKMDIKAEIFSDEEIDVGHKESQCSNFVVNGVVSPHISETKFLRMLTQNGEHLNVWAEELPSSEVVDVKQEVKAELSDLKKEAESETTTSNTFIWDEETSSFHVKHEKEDDSPVEVLTVVEDEEDDEIRDIEEDNERIHLNMSSTISGRSTEIDEALEMELLRGDTPIVCNTETDKEKETEKNSMETVPDTSKSVPSNEENEEIIIEDSNHPTSVEEVSRSPEIISEEISPKSPDPADSNSGNLIVQTQNSQEIIDTTVEVLPTPKSQENFTIDKCLEIAVSDDDNESFIRLDVGNDNDLFSHADANDDDVSVTHINRRPNVEEEVTVETSEKDDLIIEKEIPSVEPRKENVENASRKSVDRSSKHYRARSHFEDRKHQSDLPLAVKYKRDLEERELRELRNQKEKLLALDRKQKYEAERLEREREKLRLEKEKLMREKNDLIRKELEWERERLEREKEQLRKEKLKYKANHRHEESSNLGSNNAGGNLRGMRAMSCVPKSGSSLLRHDSSGNKFQTENRRSGQGRDHFFDRFNSRKSPQRFHSNDLPKYANDETQSLRHFLHSGPSRDRSRGYRGSVTRANYKNRPSRCTSRSKSTSRTRSRSRSRSISREIFRQRTRSRSKSRPRQICAKVRSRSRSRFRSRSRSIECVDIDERESFQNGNQQDWVSDDETDRYGNPRLYERNNRNFAVPSPSSIICLENEDNDGGINNNTTTNFVTHRPYNRNNPMFRRRGGILPGRGNPTCNNRNFSANQNSYQPSTSRYQNQNNLTVVQTNEEHRPNFFLRGRGRRNNWKSPFREPDSSSYWQ